MSWTTIPITWPNRRTGTPKLRIKEMDGRYLFICLEKYFSAGDYRRTATGSLPANPPKA
jgi:dolichol-phosphate mannosyltransferase